MSARGYTLIEGIFALLLTAILCQLAWTGYDAVLRRTHRQQAQVRLLQAALWVEQQRVTQGRLVDAQGLALQLPPELAVGEVASRWAYAVELRVTDAGGYVLEAEPLGWHDPDCGTLRLEAQGRRHASGAWGSARCWQR